MSMQELRLVAEGPQLPTARDFLTSAGFGGAAALVAAIILVLIAIFAPYLATVDPTAISPVKRLRQPSAQYWFGTDMLGRDVYSRTLYGARVSLIVGFAVAVLSSGAGMLIGVCAGYLRVIDAVT